MIIRDQNFGLNLKGLVLASSRWPILTSLVTYTLQQVVVYQTKQHLAQLVSNKILI